jgi:hypothetical protein
MNTVSASGQNLQPAFRNCLERVFRRGPATSFSSTRCGDIMSKRLGSPYRSGRSNYWRKPNIRSTRCETARLSVSGMPCGGFNQLHCRSRGRSTPSHVVLVAPRMARNVGGSGRHPPPYRPLTSGRALAGQIRYRIYSAHTKYYDCGSQTLVMINQFSLDCAAVPHVV